MKRIFKVSTILKIIASGLLCQLAGFTGSFFTRTSVDTWYLTINKPFFNPPSWVFAPVWIILYFLMGISAFLVWDKASKQEHVRKAIGIFLLQLVLNIAWFFTFFGMQNILLSVITMIFLWASIQWTIISFYKISKPAAVILLPYSFWVSFAAILNVTILFLNLK